MNGERLQTYNNSSVQDTFSLVEGSMKTPMQFGGGFSIVRPGRWTVSGDVSYHDWSRFNYFGDANPYLNSLDFRVGGEWIPDLLSRNYGKKIAYRAGFYSQGAYLTVDGEPIREMGFTFGMGLPLGRLSATGQNYSRVNVGLSLGRRGTQNANLLEETTLNVRVGVNLNEIWFIKRKID